MVLFVFSPIAAIFFVFASALLSPLGMFSSGSEWELGDRHGLWERWDAGKWET